MSLIPRQTYPSLFLQAFYPTAHAIHWTLIFASRAVLFAEGSGELWKECFQTSHPDSRGGWITDPVRLLASVGQCKNDVSREETTNFWWREGDCVNLILRRGCPNPKYLADVICERPPWWIIVINGRARRKACHKLRSPSRQGIVRGFFHRENRILFRKSQIFDLDTIFYSP